MKKLITVISSALLVSVLCTNVYSQCTPPAPSGSPGITPDWQDLPCVERGVSYTGQINIENFDTLGITSLRIDSIVGLPQGLDYFFSNGTKKDTFSAGATGCLAVTGTTNCPTGRYKLGIYATVTLALGTFSNEACVLYGILATGDCPFSYYAMVIDSGAVCDTNATVVSRGDTVAASVNTFRNCNVTNAITELLTIGEVNIYPNPFNNGAIVSFNSEESGVFNVSLHDLAGKTVMSEEIKVTNGSNRYELVRNSLPEGVYFFALSKEGKAITRKVTISK